MDINAAVKKIYRHLNRLTEIADGLGDAAQGAHLRCEVERARACTHTGLVSPVLQRFPEFDPEQLVAGQSKCVPASPEPRESVPIPLRKRERASCVARTLPAGLIRRVQLHHSC